MASFDHTTARIFIRRAGKSSQDIYKDAQGNLCLKAQSALNGGGAAVSVAAVEALRGMEAPAKFVRVVNEESRFDAIMPLGRLDAIMPVQGRYGDFIPVDPEDDNNDDFGVPGEVYS